MSSSAAGRAPRRPPTPVPSPSRCSATSTPSAERARRRRSSGPRRSRRRDRRPRRGRRRRPTRAWAGRRPDAAPSAVSERIRVPCPAAMMSAAGMARSVARRCYGRRAAVGEWCSWQHARFWSSKLRFESWLPSSDEAAGLAVALVFFGLALVMELAVYRALVRRKRLALGYLVPLRVVRAVRAPVPGFVVASADVGGQEAPPLGRFSSLGDGVPGEAGAKTPSDGNVSRDVDEVCSSYTRWARSIAATSATRRARLRWRFER